MQFVKVLFILCFLYEHVNSLYLDENNGYNEIVIELNDNLNENDCDVIKNNILTMLSKTSLKLRSATEDFDLWFKTAKIIIPNKWKGCGNLTIDQIEQIEIEAAQFKIGKGHPIFGDNPWTQQFRPCGHQGEFIYIPEGFLTGVRNQSAQILVQEWAKYRWGVFEEYGHIDDKIYPSKYLDMSQNFVQNKCTNQPKKQMNNNRIAPYSTSIMAFKNTFQVNHFCNSSNHISNPSKHQTLCNGKSAWDIMLKHQDFRTKPKNPLSAKSPKIFLARRFETKRRKFAIVFENSGYTTNTPNKWNYIKESIIEIIKYSVEDNSGLSLLEYSSEASILYLFSIIDKKVRDNMVSVMEETKPKNNLENIPLEKMIALAASEIGENGIILLIANSTSIKAEIKIIEASLNRNTFCPIIFDKFENAPKNDIENLAVKSGCFLTIIFSDQHMPELQMRLDLTEKLRDVFNYFQEIKHIQKRIGWCYWKSCDLLVKNPQKKELFISSFYTNPPKGLNIVLDGEKCNLDYVGSSFSSFKCSNSQWDTSTNFASNITVTQIDNEQLTLKLSYLRKDGNSAISVYSSHDMSRLNINKNEINFIYAKVLLDNNLVLNATVFLIIQINSEIYDISLNDNGIHGDVTGNDGIYTAAISNFLITTGVFTYKITAYDNYKQSLYLDNSMEPETPQICCGSKLRIDNFQKTDYFSSSTKLFYGFVENVTDKIFRPGKITDLVAIYDNSYRITFYFTSTGEYIYSGRAKQYRIYEQSEENLTFVNSINEPKPPGEKEEITIQSNSCDTVNIYYITAINTENQQSDSSNHVRVRIPCSQEPIINQPINYNIILLYITILFGFLFSALLFFGHSFRRIYYAKSINETDPIWTIT